MDPEMKRTRRVADSLKASRQPWEDHFTDLEQHFLPRRGGFSSDPANKAESDRGKRLNRKMLESTPMRALRILKSGMHAGVTSPSRPWFRIQPVDPDKRERPAVKKWLSKVEYEMRRVLSRGGLYNMLHTGYGDLGVYGTEAAIIEDKGDIDLRGIQLVPGSFWLGMSGEDYIDTLYREFGMSLGQVVGKFVFKGNPRGEPDWDVVPHRIKKMYDDGDIGKMVTVCQLIMPRMERDERRMDKSNKPIASQYWLKDDDRADSMKKLLANSGYNRNPISASRWETAGHEVWGRSPAMEALPDTKELMSVMRDLAEMRKRLNRPPMNAHTDLRNSRFSLLPGSVNFMADPDKGLRPAFQTDPRFDAINEQKAELKDSIWSAMYADLFMMISNLDRRMITATEIDERREEKLIALGPVLERLHFEKLTPLVKRVYQRVVDSGIAGPAPQELDGEPLEIDFVSMLAQAQKAVATGSMERFAAYVGNVAAAKPGVLDKLDEDQAIDEYADMIGVPPGVVRSDEETRMIRQQRQQAEAQAAAVAQAVEGTKAMQQGAQAAKVLSEADAPRGAQPTDILNRLGLGQR